jgi:hypothetical protein
MAGDTGHGLDLDSGLRGAGTKRLQHTLFIHLLSPAAAVQQRGRLRGRKTSAGQRSERRRLEAASGAGD